VGEPSQGLRSCHREKCAGKKANKHKREENRGRRGKNVIDGGSGGERKRELPTPTS